VVLRRLLARQTWSSVRGTLADDRQRLDESVLLDEAAGPFGTVLEWGVRALNKSVEVNAEGDLPARATADLFPAYDDDGGMLLVLTPAK
jgi:hypothetical protein